jgi:hypothetical protein
MKNKTYMTSKPQHTHNPHQLNQMCQLNQWLAQKTIGNCMQTGKVNSIDYQQLKYQNT